MDFPQIAKGRFGIELSEDGQFWWSAPCPQCSGEDRFIVSKQTGWYQCRKCGFHGWVHENEKEFKRTPQTELYAKEKREEIRRANAESLKSWQEGFNTGYVIGWHNAMNAQQKKYWLDAGICEVNVDRYMLGYCPAKPVFNKKTGEFVKLPAYTIPIHDAQHKTLVNVQYRLVDPPIGIKKYRQESDVPSAEFYANESQERDALLVEGAKKAIVLSQLVQDKIQVIGLPGISFNETIAERIREFKFRHIWFIPDPDVTENQVDPYRAGLPNLRVVTMPSNIKIDDAINVGWLHRGNFNSYLRYSRA